MYTNKKSKILKIIFIGIMVLFVGICIVIPLRSKLHTSQDLSLKKGKFILQGIYNGMTFNEMVHQLAVNQGIDDSQRDYNNEFDGVVEYSEFDSIIQSGDYGEGDDTVIVSEQIIFDCPCSIYLNFDWNLQSSNTTIVPLLERIYCLFPQGYDKEQQVKKTFFSMFGKPTKTYTDEEYGLDYGYEWTKKNGDTLTLWYAQTDNNELAIHQIVITSNAYIEKLNALKENTFDYHSD